MLSLSFAFRDSQNLCFALKLGCTPSDTIPPTCHTASRSSRSRKISSPDPISCYSLSLASCSCPTLHSCVSCSHFQYPQLNALLLISVYKTPAYVCIRHVQISTLILVFIVYSTHSVILNSDSVLPE